jgi:diguanylate cyclase (GGDEF)-like protein
VLQWLKRVLLTSDPRQQIRLAQAGLATLLMVACVALMQVLNAYGITDPRWIWPWTATAAVCNVTPWVLIRSGVTKHLRDPSLTLQQMLIAILIAAAGYCITGASRSIVLPMVAVVMMFGMFRLTQRQVRIVGAYTLLLFGAASFYWVTGPESGQPAGDELARFMMMTTMVVGVVLLTSRLHRMRERTRRQRMELAAALERISELATRDELTGCLNRRAMQERLVEECSRASRAGQPLCVVLLDLDHFKSINDRHGHAAGDAVLRGFAELARGQLRPTDLLARWGGEEFLLTLAATDALQAQECVLRLLQGLAQVHFDVVPGGLSVTASAGSTQWRRGEAIEAAIERADRALYCAKANGRNRVEQV